MHLTEFSIKNYRSLLDVPKIRCSSQTILLGQNNEGKSNVLRALNISLRSLLAHADPRTPFYYRAAPRSRRNPEYIFDWNRDFPTQLQTRKQGRRSIFKLTFKLTEQQLIDFQQNFRSQINGFLRFEVSFGEDNRPAVKFLKQGPHSAKLAERSAEICQFVAQRVYFNYIPAIRTEHDAIEVVRGILSRELQQLEETPNYQEAMESLRSIQEPKLNEISETIRKQLEAFIPDIRQVSIEIIDDRRRASLRQDFDINIDDGNMTRLEQKGDGIKSLVALALLRDRRTPGASIIAIEEPESHLHPGAIHKLKHIIDEMADSSQILVSTHNPLFVNRFNIRSNIIVAEGKAQEAKNINTIRKILGVRAADNLSSASFVLLVEGETDKRALSKILSDADHSLQRALREGNFAIDHMGGASSLSYKVSTFKTMLCEVYAFLDSDAEAKAAFDRALEDDLLKVGDCHFATCPGLREAELEDLYDINQIRQIIWDYCEVEIERDFTGSNKFSHRLGECFRRQGKMLDNQILNQIKQKIADLASVRGYDLLHSARRGAVDALIAKMRRIFSSFDR